MVLVGGLQSGVIGTHAAMHPHHSCSEHYRHDSAGWHEQDAVADQSCALQTRVYLYIVCRPPPKLIGGDLIRQKLHFIVKLKRVIYQTLHCYCCRTAGPPPSVIDVDQIRQKLHTVKARKAAAAAAGGSDGSDGSSNSGRTQPTPEGQAAAAQRLVQQPGRGAGPSGRRLQQVILSHSGQNTYKADSPASSCRYTQSAQPPGRAAGDTLGTLIEGYNLSLLRVHVMA